MEVRVQVEDFDLCSELDKIRKRHCDIGALASFVGIVREHGGVSGMELEHYPGMTEAALEAILHEAKHRWAILDATVIHRVGRLEGSEQIVLAIVASSHRKEAFLALEFIVDKLKTEAPLWKKEKTREGWKWVDAKASDETAASRWIE